jgi:putative phage-type endonuclease
MITKTATVAMTREDWLDLRRGSIGGSDAAAIVGLNEFSSPYTVWADKMGLLPDKEDSEAMRQGRDLEQYVAERFEEATGKRVKRSNYTWYNTDYPFAHATVDRVVIGEDAGLECKTTSILNPHRFADGDYPANYYVQCQHYMAVTGKSRWYLAVLVLNKGFYWYCIERDQQEIDALMAAEAALWDCVKNKTQPPIDGTKATTDALSVIYADAVPKSGIELYGREYTIQNLMRTKEQIKELEKQAAEFENELKADMGEHEAGYAGEYRVMWKVQERTNFDSKRFIEDSPGMDLSAYFKTTAFRSFKISKRKGA